MVENMYVMERLAAQKVQDFLQMAEQHRLARSASEAARPSAPKELVTWAIGSRRPAAKRA
ncbi:MAG TPA: hypothetical protein VGK88_04920 [bacterium]